MESVVLELQYKCAWPIDYWKQILDHDWIGIYTATGSVI